MNGSLPHPELHNSETDPDSWSCSRSRDTSPESSIPPGMPSFRVIPLTCESEVGSSDPFCNNDAGPSYSGTLLRGSEPPEWETEPLQRAGSAQPPATLLRKNQYWVCFKNPKKECNFGKKSYFNFFLNSNIYTYLQNIYFTAQYISQCMQNNFIKNLMSGFGAKCK